MRCSTGSILVISLFITIPYSLLVPVTKLGWDIFGTFLEKIPSICFACCDKCSEEKWA